MTCFLRSSLGRGGTIKRKTEYIWSSPVQPPVLPHNPVRQDTLRHGRLCPLATHIQPHVLGAKARGWNVCSHSCAQKLRQCERSWAFWGLQVAAMKGKKVERSCLCSYYRNPPGDLVALWFIFPTTDMNCGSQCQSLVKRKETLFKSYTDLE